MFTWDKFEKHSGIGNFITLPNAICTERFFPKGTPILPEEIKTVEKFKSELPNTFNVIVKPVYESVDVEAIKKVIPNAKIIIEQENDFTVNMSNRISIEERAEIKRKCFME
jgi:hypothetical protein